MAEGSYEGHSDIDTKIILENEAKGIQYRWTISQFRDKFYIGIREWYVGFEGEWLPTRNGITMPYELHVCSRLFDAFYEILSTAETLEKVLDATDTDRPVYREDSGADSSS